MPLTSPPPCRASSSPVAAGKLAAAAPASRLSLLRLSRQPVRHAASCSTQAGVRKSARTATAIRQTGARDENPYVQPTAGRLHLARGAGEIGRASCKGKSVDLGGRRIIKKKKSMYREKGRRHESAHR